MSIENPIFGKSTETSFKEPNRSFVQSSWKGRSLCCLGKECLRIESSENPRELKIHHIKMSALQELRNLFNKVSFFKLDIRVKVCTKIIKVEKENNLGEDLKNVNKSHLNKIFYSEELEMIPFSLSRMINKVHYESLGKLGLGNLVSQFKKNEFIDLEKKFHELLKKNMAAALNFAHECIGKDDEAAQAVVKQMFLQLFENDPPRADSFAVKCIGYQDKASQDVVKNWFDYIKQNVFEACCFAEKCIGQGDEVFQDIVKKTFAILLQQPNTFQAEILAKGCIGKKDKASQEVVNQMFLILLKQNRNKAQAFAEQCIGKKDKASQDIVKKMFLLLKENSSYQARLFAEKCQGKVDEASQYVVNNKA